METTRRCGKAAVKRKRMPVDEMDEEEKSADSIAPSSPVTTTAASGDTNDIPDQEDCQDDAEETEVVQRTGSDTDSVDQSVQMHAEADLSGHSPSQLAHLWKLACVNNRCLVVALQKPEQIARRVVEQGLHCAHTFPLTLKSLGAANRRAYERNQRSRRSPAKKSKKRHDSEDSGSEYEGSIPEGEWEVNEIVDWGLDDCGRVIFQVNWRGWEGEDTWEPEENLTNSAEAVKAFRDRRQKQETEQHRRTLRDLRLLVEKLCTEDGDVGLLFKLFRYKPDYEQKMTTKVSELRQKLLPKLKLLRGFDDKTSPLTAEGVIDLVTKEFGLKDPLEEVKGLMELADARKECLRKLKKREAKLRTRIDEEGDKYNVTMENLVDATLPQKFEYIREYYYLRDVQKPVEPFAFCSLPEGKDKNGCSKQGCGLEKGRCPCVKESGRIPYGKDGTLLLDAREPIYECNSKCVCADTCRFRVVARGCNLSFCIFKTDGVRGWGLRAMERIPKGKFITTYNGEVLSSNEKNQRDRTQEEWQTTYMFDLDYNPEENDAEILAVDARFKGNLARFINHSCDPNLQINPCWNENQDRRMPLIAFFTTRAINKGEELTIDYDARSGEAAMLNSDLLQMVDPAEWNDPHTATRICRCGAHNCRGFIM